MKHHANRANRGDHPDADGSRGSRGPHGTVEPQSDDTMKPESAAPAPGVRLRARRKKMRRPPPGSMPGTLAVDPTLPPSVMHLLAYGPSGLEECNTNCVDRLREILAGAPMQASGSPAEPWPVVWLDVDGLGSPGLLEQIAAAAGLHNLSLADIVNANQRPKFEDFNSYIMVIVRTPFTTAGESLDTEQISICLGKGFVLTFQEQSKPGDCFDAVRDRIRKSIGSIRSRGADYLMYSLLDAAVDAYFPLLESMGERLDHIEEAQSALNSTTMRELHLLRREFLTVRRAAWPLREAVGAVQREPTPLISDSTRIYLRDCYDHTIQVMDLIETARELGAGLMEIQMTLASYRMNEVMKVLTVITTIFIPLSFIAGIYGMNFDTSKPGNMPETLLPYAYPTLLVTMTLLAFGMLAIFYRKGWIGRGS
jgi:magnesium transporter